MVLPTVWLPDFTIVRIVGDTVIVRTCHVVNGEGTAIYPSEVASDMVQAYVDKLKQSSLHYRGVRHDV